MRAVRGDDPTLPRAELDLGTEEYNRERLEALISRGVRLLTFAETCGSTNSTLERSQQGRSGDGQGRPHRPQYGPVEVHYRSMARTWTLMAHQKDRLRELLWDKKRSLGCLRSVNRAAPHPSRRMISADFGCISIGSVSTKR